MFKSTENYIASDELRLAVNAAITLEKPLLIKGEPGTGKTQLAEELAKSLNCKLYQWHIKSTKRNKVYMNTMRYHACVTVNLVMKR